MMEQTDPRILIIEDDENDEFFLSRALKQAGAPEPYLVCRTGDEAVANLAEIMDNGNGAKAYPDVVFLDLHLPGRSGLEVLRWIRRQPRLGKAIIVLLTGSRDESKLNTAYEIGANTYLVKPPSQESLRVIFKALDRYEVEFETG